MTQGSPSPICQLERYNGFLLPQTQTWTASVHKTTYFWNSFDILRINDAPFLCLIAFELKVGTNVKGIVLPWQLTH